MSEHKDETVNQRRAPEENLEDFIQRCRVLGRCITGSTPRHVYAVCALADQRDEALQALKMLCEHHYTYAGADADTANDHGLYAKVRTARKAFQDITGRDTFPVDGVG